MDCAMFYRGQVIEGYALLRQGGIKAVEQVDCGDQIWSERKEYHGGLFVVQAWQHRNLSISERHKVAIVYKPPNSTFYRRMRKWFYLMIPSDQL